MPGRRPRLAAALVAFVSASSPALAAPAGWQEDDQRAALAAFIRSCPSAPRHFGPACRAARRLGETRIEGARRFFETWFDFVDRRRPDGALGFLTGYFEPEFPGALTRQGSRAVPLLSRPTGLVIGPRSGALPRGWPPGMSAAIRWGATYRALPDRAAIEDGAVPAGSRPIVFLADPVDAFAVHVQGSARIALPDGRAVQVGFDGRNGHPYSAIARLAAERAGLPPAEMTADRLWDWLKAHPAEAREVMRTNQSYIFFRSRAASGEVGPIGAAGTRLMAGRSLATDPTVTPYGTPVWLDAAPSAGLETGLRRLVVAQDTGAAIVGPARGDLFVGTGSEAGRQAGRLRERVGWTELRPRQRPFRGDTR